MEISDTPVARKAIISDSALAWLFTGADGRDHPYFQGCDPGVSFISEYNPNDGLISVMVSNFGDNVWEEMRNIRSNFKKDS